MGQASFVLEVQELLEGQVDGKRDRFAVTNMRCKERKKEKFWRWLCAGAGMVRDEAWLQAQLQQHQHVEHAADGTS